jgi:nicotinamide riboside kinase
MARIGFCGTTSVGKTTLVNALRELPEFSEYQTRTERSKYLNDLGIPLNTDSTLKGQTIFLAERCSELLQDNIITDRTVIDVMAFTALAKSIDPKAKSDFLNHAANLINEYDYIFYVDPSGVEIEDNGVRTIDAEYRNDIDYMINFYIAKYSDNIKNLTKIKGDHASRIEIIMDTLFPSK